MPLCVFPGKRVVLIMIECFVHAYGATLFILRGLSILVETHMDIINWTYPGGKIILEI